MTPRAAASDSNSIAGEAADHRATSISGEKLRIALFYALGAVLLIGALYSISVGNNTGIGLFVAASIVTFIIAAFGERLQTFRAGPTGFELSLVGVVVATPEAEAFLERIKGSWWEIIDSHEARSAVSLCTIFLSQKTIMLKGTGYREDGSESANWASQMVRFDPSENHLTYLWRGHWTGKDEGLDFHGLGMLDFDLPEGQPQTFKRATGYFWHVDEAHPASTVRNRVRFRRAESTSEEIMRDGTSEAKVELLDDVLRRWPRQDTDRVQFNFKSLSAAKNEVAPDGSDVRSLLELTRGSMAHFEIGPGATSIPVAHRSVEEIWYVLTGQGEMWRKQGTREETVSMEAGVCVTLPIGTSFQFRCTGGEPLTAIATTMPPWPAKDEAYEVDGKWPATLR